VETQWRSQLRLIGCSATASDQPRCGHPGSALVCFPISSVPPARNPCGALSSTSRREVVATITHQGSPTCRPSLGTWHAIRPAAARERPSQLVLHEAVTKDDLLLLGHLHQLPPSSWSRPSAQEWRLLQVTVGILQRYRHRCVRFSRRGSRRGQGWCPQLRPPSHPGIATAYALAAPRPRATVEPAVEEAADPSCSPALPRLACGHRDVHRGLRDALPCLPRSAGRSHSRHARSDAGERLTRARHHGGECRGSPDALLLVGLAVRMMIDRGNPSGPHAAASSSLNRETHGLSPGSLRDTARTVDNARRQSP